MEPGACCLNALPGDSDGLVGVVGEAQLNCSLPLGFRYGLTGWISKLTVSMKLFFQVSLWGPHLAMFLVQTRHAGQSSRKDRSDFVVKISPGCYIEKRLCGQAADGVRVGRTETRKMGYEAIIIIWEFGGPLTVTWERDERCSSQCSCTAGGENHPILSIF